MNAASISIGALLVHLARSNARPLTATLPSFAPCCIIPSTGRSGLLDWMRQMRPDTTLRGAPPPISQKGAWFDFWDEDRSGELDKDECTRALIKTFKLSQHLDKVSAMRDTVEAIWGCFDIDGGGGIDRDEFLVPNVGLADTIIASTSFL